MRQRHKREGPQAVKFHELHTRCGDENVLAFQADEVPQLTG